MFINKKVLSLFNKNQTQFLAVTKYLPAKETQEVLMSLADNPSFLGLGENRIDSLKEKKLPRKQTHFIGNIQSRDLEDIMMHCSVIQSLSNENHFNKIEKLLKKYPTKFYLQIKVSKEDSKSGIEREKLGSLMRYLQDFPKIQKSLQGFMGIGAYEADNSQIEKEIKLLKEARDHYLPSGKISYGTSQNYQSALEKGVEVVRIGKALWESF